MVLDSEIVDRHALTPAQSGLLYHALSEPEQHVFVERLVCPLYGDIDIPAFVRVWQKLVARHASLRTGFSCDGPEGPVQVVHRSAHLEIRVEDWSGCEPDEVTHRTNSALADELERGFDLERPPLMRMTLARTAKDESLFLWSSHHLIVDGWSCWILLCEAALLYLADQSGVEFDLPPCPGFIDYARWATQQDRTKQHRDYWLRYFDGFRQLPTAAPKHDGPREFHQDHACLSRETTQQILAWQRQSRTPLNTLLQAAWALVLAQQEEPGAEEVLFGSVFSGRNVDFPGVTNLAGLMISVLPVRVALSQDLLVKTWLETLQERHAEMLLHDSCTVQEVRRWAGLDAERLSFASVLLLMNVDPLDRLPPLGFRIGRPRYLANANYPLGVNVTPGDQMEIDMLFDERYYSADRIQDLQSLFASAIDCVVDAREEQVGDLQRRLRKLSRQLVHDRRRGLVTRLGNERTVPASGDHGFRRAI